MISNFQFFPVFFDDESDGQVKISKFDFLKLHRNKVLIRLILTATTRLKFDKLEFQEVKHPIKIKNKMGTFFVISVISVSEKKLKYFSLGDVKGHAGKLVIGKLANKIVVVMNGRFHAYEGLN